MQIVVALEYFLKEQVKDKHVKDALIKDNVQVEHYK
jgi:hypothetical protein